jgi:hypothetical protein
MTATTTPSYIVGQLNAIYGAGTYAYDATSDPTTGGGPSGLIYNTHTVKDVGAVGIGPVSDSGAARAPIRYTLQPMNAGASAQFYLYVSHMKSGSAGNGQAGSNGYRRNVEANEIRSDAATLGANAHIIYSGDFNVDSSSEPAYQTMVSSTLDSGVGHAIDPQNGAWGLANLTETDTHLQYRDDFQFVTNPMLNGSGLDLVAGSYTVFGNNGSVSGSVYQSGNTALNDLSNPMTVLYDLTTATDHLPVVADYTVAPTPVPSTLILLAAGGACALASVAAVKSGRRECRLSSPERTWRAPWCSNSRKTPRRATGSAEFPAATIVFAPTPPGGCAKDPVMLMRIL